MVIIEIGIWSDHGGILHGLMINRQSFEYGGFVSEHYQRFTCAQLSDLRARLTHEAGHSYIAINLVMREG